MVASNITITLAEEQDAPTLALITTAAFAASDAAYPLIWGSAPEGTHEMMAHKFLFTPVQRKDRITFKAVDEESGKLAGFATWMMPREKVPITGGGGGMPPMEGVNTKLWDLKNGPSRLSAERDEDPEKDMRLAFFFVLPEFQRRGIGSQLLEWGKKKADELGAKIWLTAMPKALSVYQANGWEIVENHTLDLSEHGGDGIYVRSWMLRKPDVA